MKSKAICFALASLNAFAVSALAASLSADSKISTVTVYNDRALVTRVGEIKYPAGETEVVFGNLPATLLDGSIQVSGSGGNTLTILDVNTRTVFTAAIPDTRVSSMEDQIKAVQKELRVVNDRAAILAEQKQLLTRIEQSIAAPPGKDVNVPRQSFEEWQKLLNFAEENRGKYATEQQALDQQRAEFKTKLDALNAQLNDLRGHSPAERASKSVTVRIASDQANAGTIRITYAVPNASWNPVYEARLSPDTSSVTLNYFGSVRQNTGEDWSSVALTLSTARPSLGGVAPEFGTWIVDVARPMPVAMPASRGYLKKDLALMEQKTVAGGMSSNAVADELDARAAAATFSVASVETGLTSAVFRIAAPTTVLSDNTPQKVSITNTQLSAALEDRATPRLQETAFLYATVTNTSDYPLLRGSLNTFLGDNFIATSQLRTVMPGEKFELSLGADEGIAVKRRVVNRFTEQTGLTNSGRRVTYEFLVTLTNNKKIHSTVVFKELIPVSRNEKISVNLITPAEREIGTSEKPKEIVRDNEGKLVWRAELKPGEKREFPLKFNVEYPGDLAVTGLE